jgi:hypothetical protein
MCPCYVSSSPGCYAPATVFLLGKGELGKSFLDCRFRSSET